MKNIDIFLPYLLKEKSIFTTENLIELILFIMIIVVIVIVYSKNSTSKKVEHSANDKNFDVFLKSYDMETTTEEFLNIAFDIFVNSQNAWLKEDKELLKTLITPELLEHYNELTIKAKENNKELHMDNIIRKYMHIDSYIISGSKMTVKVFLIVNAYDYITDKDGNVIKGNNKTKVKKNYTLTFIGDVKGEKLKVCPHCNQELKAGSNKKCNNCDKEIVSRTHKWLLSDRTLEH